MRYLILSAAIIAVASIGCGKSNTPVTKTVTSFTISHNDSLFVDMPVQFNNSVPNESLYLWTFGDGSTSTLSAPSHTYDKDGAFDVKLVVNGMPQYAQSTTINVSKNFAKMVVAANQGRIFRHFEGKGYWQQADSFVQEDNTSLSISYTSPLTIRVDGRTELTYDIATSSNSMLHFSYQTHIGSSDSHWDLYFNPVRDTMFYRERDNAHGYFIRDMILRSP